MTRHALSAPLAIWLALVTGPAAALTCSVDFKPDGDFLVIQSLVQTDQAAIVDYMVKVQTRSASGVSVSQQGGAVTVPAGGASVPLGRTVINNRPDGTVLVHVDVRADGETASCTAETAMRNDQEL